MPTFLLKEASFTTNNLLFNTASPLRILLNFVYKLPFNDRSPLINNLAFIETSLLINNREFIDTSPPIKRREFIETSPF